MNQDHVNWNHVALVWLGPGGKIGILKKKNDLGYVFANGFPQTCYSQFGPAVWPDIANICI